MCGIIGIVGAGPCADRLIESLRRLEYRGYDSAGIAGLVDTRIERRRAAGKLSALEAVLAAEPLAISTGIGHTRWATHGAPTTRNAHPQVCGRVAVVHNGIIENYAELKAELSAEGRVFESDTDTEVVAQLIDRELCAGAAPDDAFARALARLAGAYALAVLIAGDAEVIYGARRGPPLAIGYGDGEMYIGSDALALGPFTRRIAYLDDGDHVRIDHAGARVSDSTGSLVARAITVAPRRR